MTGTLGQTQTLVGRPCLFNEYFPEWRCFPAILRDAQGHLTCGRNRLNLGGATAAPAAAGPVCVTCVRLPLEAAPQFHFAFRDPAGGIQDLWHTRKEEKDQWFSLLLNGLGETQAPPAAGNPSGCFDAQSYHVVYRDREGGVQDLAFDGVWRAELLNLDGSTQGPPAAGDPIQLQLQGRRHVLYRDGDGKLRDLWFEHGWQLRTLNLGGLTDAPAAAGDPAGLEHLKTAHVAYRDRDGQVQDLQFDGTWHARRLTGEDRADAPPAAGDPVLAVLGGGRIPHLVYRDGAGALRDLAYDGTWTARKLNAGGVTDGPPAASDPFLLVPPSNWEYIGYVDRQGAGQLLTHYGQQAEWIVVPLNAATPPGGPMEKWKSAHKHLEDR